ncbi:MAG: Ig-like domain repeat protein [Betaproteobacteria bacterium]|nr:Ig-like domain repeat protein [Betaproteobacteria bacterium]
MAQRLRRTLPACLLGLTAAALPGWTGSSALTLAPTADPALVAWYPLDGDPNDAIGTHHATLAGGNTYTAGVTGRALRFDGSTGYASVPAFDMGSEWSVEAWVRPDTCGDGLHCPFFARSNGNFDGLLLAQVTGAHPLSGQFVFDIGNGAGWQLALASGATFAQRAWHHVVATRSGDTYALFVDGEQRAQQTVSGVSATYQSLPIRLGYWNWGTQAFLGGALDEVRIFSRALAGGEIGTSYRTGIGIVALPFRDEFSAALRPAWRRTNEDAAALAVQASALQLTTTPTDMYGGSNNVKNLATLRLPDVPGGYALTAKMSFQAQPGGANPQAGIALLADDGGAPDLDNYLRAVYGNETQRVFEVVYDIDGAGNGDIPNGAAFDIPADTPYWLRLVRAGSTLRAGYSFDGTQFIPFSAATTASFAAGEAKPMAYAGIFALQGNGSVATPVAFDVDYAELTTTCSNLPAGLVSWWSGENSAEDATGANPGTAVGGVAYAAGQLGQAFLLDGSTGYIQNTNPVGLPLGAAPRTMMLWFRTPVNLASATEAAMVQYGSAAGGQMFALITSGNAPGRLYFYGHSSDVAGQTSLLPNTWYHAAVSYDGTTVRLYVNGQPDGQSAMGLNTQLSGDGLTIGLRHSSSRWQGEIDDVAIFDRALGAAEIAAVYQAGSTGACFAAPSPTSLQITSHLPHPSVVGTPVSVHVALSVVPPGGGTPTGTIEVSDGAASCSIVLPATACDLTLASVGTATITAHYPGDSNFAASDAAGVAHTVVDMSAQSPLTVLRTGSAAAAA